jgi:lipopolysaccharide biosynthesis protein
MKRLRLRQLFGQKQLRVLEAQRSAVRLEGYDSLAALTSADRVAVVAHWASDSRVDRSATTLVNALMASRYAVVFVSASEGEGHLAWTDGRPAGITVLRRPNVGYDFGSWATAIDRYPIIGSSARVLLVNDSLVGPFESIATLLDGFHKSKADVWGMTDTTQFAYHLQSYCLGFGGHALREPPIARFWSNVRAVTSRDEAIWDNEIALGRLLGREHFTMEAAIPYWRVVSDGQNPTILGWRRLLDAGFPFVKRQLLREPQVAPDAVEIPEHLLSRYGVAVREWV